MTAGFSIPCCFITLRKVRSMKCRNIQQKLSAYQDGELNPGEKQEVAIHIQGCRHCSKEFAELERVWQIVGNLPEILPDEGFYGQIVTRINEQQEHDRRSNFLRIFQLLRGPAIASILFIAGILAGGYLGNAVSRSGFLTFEHGQVMYWDERTVLGSLRAFDPVVPGTFADGYLRMASHVENETR